MMQKTGQGKSLEEKPQCNLLGTGKKRSPGLKIGGRGSEAISVYRVFKKRDIVITELAPGTP